MVDDRRGLLAAVLAETGVPWWLAVEAVASTELSRDDEVGTFTVDDAEVCRCGRHLPCRHCPEPPADVDGLSDEERAEFLRQWKDTYAAREDKP